MDNTKDEYTSHDIRSHERDGAVNIRRIDATPSETDADWPTPSMEAGADIGLQTDATPVIEDAGDDSDGSEPSSHCAELPTSMDHCLQVPYLGGPPLMDGVLDGEIDCAPPLTTLVPIAWTGNAPIPPGNSARYTMGYREDGVYVFIEVTDPDRLPAPAEDWPWMGDGVEVYLDNDGSFQNVPEYDAPGTYQFVIAAPEDDMTPSTRATRYRDTVEQGSWESSRFATFPTETGYVLEAWFSASDLRLSQWPLQPGGHIGFNISINVSPPPSELDNSTLDGTRLGQYFLYVGSDFCGHPYCSTESFCTPELLPENQSGERRQARQMNSDL